MALAQLRRLRRRRGMAMVEMIFVLPVLLILVFAIAEFGILFSRWLTLSNAVREGARELVVFREPCDPSPDGTVVDAVKTRVKNYASAGGVTLADGDISVSGQCDDSGTDGTVQADFDFSVDVPFAPGLGTINLTYTSQMRNE